MSNVYAMISNMTRTLRVTHKKRGFQGLWRGRSPGQTCPLPGKRPLTGQSAITFSIDAETSLSLFYHSQTIRVHYLLTINLVLHVNTNMMVLTTRINRRRVTILSLHVKLKIRYDPSNNRAKIQSQPNKRADTNMNIMNVTSIFKSLLPTTVPKNRPIPRVIIIYVTLGVTKHVTLRLKMKQTFYRAITRSLNRVIILIITNLLLRRKYRHSSLQGTRALLVRLLMRHINGLPIGVQVRHYGMIIRHVVHRRFMNVQRRVTLAFRRAI